LVFILEVDVHAQLAISIISFKLMKRSRAFLHLDRMVSPETADNNLQVKRAKNRPSLIKSRLTRTRPETPEENDFFLFASEPTPDPRISACVAISHVDKVAFLMHNISLDMNIYEINNVRGTTCLIDEPRIADVFKIERRWHSAPTEV